MSFGFSIGDYKAQLERLGMSQYLDAFVAEGFDSWETLADITESDLVAANVKLGHRRKLQRAIAERRGEPSPNPLLQNSRTTPIGDATSKSSVVSSVGAMAGNSSTSGNLVTKRKYRRHPKPDGNAPERPPSAYVLFSNHVRDTLRGQDLSFTEIAKEVGLRWERLPAEARESYERQANAGKEKYYAELAKYKRTREYDEYQGYLEVFRAKHTVLQKESDNESSSSFYNTSSERSHFSQTPSTHMGFPSATGPNPRKTPNSHLVTAAQPLAHLREYASSQSNPDDSRSSGVDIHDSAWSPPPSPVSETFSLASKDSTVMTGTSVLTQSVVKQASDQLLDIFLQDRKLDSLYVLAIYERRIGSGIFIDNFRRLLKLFSSNLKNEVQDSISLELANFISRKSTFIAKGVYHTLATEVLKPQSETFDDTKPNKTSVEMPSTFLERVMQEESGFEDGGEEQHEERFVMLVAQGRKFIEGSKAFKELQRDFQDFIVHQPQSRLEIDDHIPSGQLELMVQYFTSRWNAAYKSAVFYLDVISEKAHSVPLDHKRVRWRNSHGRVLYDDYIEHEAGALNILEDYLNTHTYRWRTNNGGEANERRSLIPGWIRRTCNNILPTKPTAVPADTTARRPEATNCAQNDVERGEDTRGTLHLLCSMVKRRYANGLHQELVTHVTSDRDLFLAIHNSYTRYRGILKPYLSLTTVHSIHFMKFRYGGEDYIDIRCHDDLCERGKHCDCVPPPDEIDPNDKWIIEQLPKRSKGKLERSSTASELEEAWGIYFKESLDLVKIWMIVAVGFVLPGLLFGVLWGHMKNDIQGAFGVASVWVTCGTVFMGMFATYTWKS